MVSGYVVETRPAPGEVHMRRDAAAFDAAEAGAPFAPELRWFAWDRPTLSLGRHEARAGFDSAALAADGVPVVVRPTGGRAVFHVDEWTYAALVPLAHPVLGGSLARSTRALTALVARALEVAYGVRCDPAAPGGGRIVDGPSACFAGSYGYELAVGGRKLMGSAQRRGRVALLQQGSLLVGADQARLARYLAAGAGPGAGAALAAGTTTLAAILGSRPDPAPFHAALAAAWRAASLDSDGTSGTRKVPAKRSGNA